MTSVHIAYLVLAAILVVVAAVFASAEAALTSMSRVRASELRDEGRAGAERLLTIASDPPRFLNTVLLVRMTCETTAIVLVTLFFVDVLEPDWAEVVVAAAVMVVVSYTAVGVGPRTIGRQHAERVARATARPITWLTAVLGPVSRLLIMIGNIVTPGKGFREGPFASEAELRELVDIAEASRVIESDESRMIHSVFELGDTLAREVMVPRTDMVFIERHKTLRQLMSLALRSGFSRIPVVGENLDDIVGIAYLKDATKRVFDKHDAETTERVESVMRSSYFVPDSKPADELLRDLQAARVHVAIVVDEYGGTAGLVTIEDLLEEIVGEITDEYDLPPDEVEYLASGAVRVSSRLEVEDLGDVFGIELDDEDVETVGGLMAKHLGKVPIPGARVEWQGLWFEAETRAGRRNKVVTVVVTPTGEMRLPSEGHRDESVSTMGGHDADPVQHDS